MKVIPIIEYSMDQNAYLVYEGTDAIVIDPGARAEKILDVAREAGVSIKYILATHGHFDHIAHIAELKAQTGAKLAVAKKTETAMNDPVINLSEGWLNTALNVGTADIILEENSIVELAGISVKTIPTPGHTADSVCFLIGDELFSGDTLFKQSVGRSDLPTGDTATLMHSIKDVLFRLDDTTKVYPGHGHETSIGYEKKFNLCI